MDERNALPAYTDQDIASDIRSSFLNIIADHDITVPIQRYAPPDFTYVLQPPTREDEIKQQKNDVERSLVDTFFQAIEKKNSELVAVLIEQGIVSPETTSRYKATPLVTATQHGNVRMVQELVDFDANVNALGFHHEAERTPLMVAAAEGNLTLVKLFVDVFHADDAIIAPDGALALRLAADNDHTEIVDFLPVRRGGGWRRWKTHHAKALRRVREAFHNIYVFIRCLVWEAPRCLLWVLPRDLVFKPARKACGWCWKNRKGFGPWCAKQAKETLRRLLHFATKTIPKVSKESAKYIWELLTYRLPKAIQHLAQWLWRGTVGNARALAAVVQRLASLIHTIVAAIFSFIQDLSLQDIRNAVVDLFKQIFVRLPITLRSWAKTLARVSYDILKTLAGTSGKILWYTCAVLYYFVRYVPLQIWTIVSNIGQSLATGSREIAVWVNPKF